MSYSRATLVQEVRYILRDTPAADSITGSYSAAGLTLSVADATLYDKGDIIEFKTDGDTFLVDSAVGTTITMIAAGLGWDGATNANHASGAVFFLRPAFRFLEIQEAIKQAIIDLWPYGWKSVTDTLIPVAGQTFYDAATSTTTGMDLIDAHQLNVSSNRNIEYGVWKGAYPIKLERSLPTGLAASTQGYNIPRLNNTTNPITVRVRAKLTNTGTTNYDDLTDGIMTDAVKYEAVARLLANTEVARDTQTDVNQGDSSVVPQARLRSAAYFKQLALEKRLSLKRELEATIPPMPRWR